MQPSSLEGGLEVLTFERLAACADVRHFVSTRGGGVSRAPYATLNLGLHVGDDPALVRENRRRLTAALGLPVDALTCAQQVHGARVRAVGPSERGRGARHATTALPDTDGLVTNSPGICLLVLQADCVPLLAYDPVRRAVGAAHAGWRGTVAEIGRALVDALGKHYGSRAADLIVAVGPSIAADDYEVGPEVIAEARTAFPSAWLDEVLRQQADRVTFDLRAANQLTLEDAGVPADHIALAGGSTYRDTARFYSARAADGPTGRFGAGIMLDARHETD